jgi:hypothetical protein
MTEVREITLYDLAMTNWYAESGIREVDWYNAFTSSLIDRDTPDGVLIYLDYVFNMESELNRWYKYEITLAPGERIVNTVTAPIYPDISARYEPPVYSYTYLLSPAKTWKSFGTLEIVVNTPYYITESSLDGFEKTEGGYKLTLPGLPDSELTFTLCSSENPEAPKTNFFYGFIYFFAMIFSYIGYLFESLFDAIGSIF